MRPALLFRFALLAIAAGLAGCSAQPPAEASLSLREHRIPGPEQGTRLYLREKHPGRSENFGADKVVLMLEPFGVPAAEAFDVRGYSWMEALASEGFDVWALDFRGFGRSTRPAVMDGPALAGPPAVRAAEGVQDVEAAVEHIRRTRNVEKVSLVGWSWGAVVASMYAIDHPDKVGRLVLHGAMHGFSLPAMTRPLEDKPGRIKAKLPAYQLAVFDMTLNHWNMMMNGRSLADERAVDEVRKVFMESDRTSRAREPNSIRRPMGPLVDLYYIWSDRPIFDAAKITAPVLVLRGDADFFADPDLIRKLSGAREKREVIIQDATHWVLYERNREVLLRESSRFLKGGN